MPSIPEFEQIVIKTKKVNIAFTYSRRKRQWIAHFLKTKFKLNANNLLTLFGLCIKEIKSRRKEIENTETHVFEVDERA